MRSVRWSRTSSTPICFQITATVEPDGGFFSLGNITGTELERAFRGFLAMGTNISIGAGDGSAFSVFSRPGHISTFEITPPVFASVRSVGPDNLTGVTSRTRAVTDLDNGNHNIGVWTVDHLGATGTDDLAADLQIGLTHRSTAATPGLQIDESSENALNVEVELDMSTGETAQITLKADVHYLSAETLESWGSPSLSWGTMWRNSITSVRMAFVWPSTPSMASILTPSPIPSPSMPSPMPSKGPSDKDRISTSPCPMPHGSRPRTSPMNPGWLGLPTSGREHGMR